MWCISISGPHFGSNPRPSPFMDWHPSGSLCDVDGRRQKVKREELSEVIRRFFFSLSLALILNRIPLPFDVLLMATGWMDSKQEEPKCNFGKTKIKFTRNIRIKTSSFLRLGPFFAFTNPRSFLLQIAEILGHIPRLLLALKSVLLLLTKLPLLIEMLSMIELPWKWKY